MRIDAYIDDSGHVSNGKVLLACGFIAPVGQWKMFEKDWRAILRLPQFDLDHLHMKEFQKREREVRQVPRQPPTSKRIVYTFL